MVTAGTLSPSTAEKEWGAGYMKAWVTLSEWAAMRSSLELKVSGPDVVGGTGSLPAVPAA
jgi:hypothetical protein